MDDISLKIMFEKVTYRIFQGEMVLVRGVLIVTLYNMLGTTISGG
jgi:hypothetical protein